MEEEQVLEEIMGKDWVIDRKEAAPHLLHLHKISNQSVKWHLQQYLHNSGSLSTNRYIQLRR